MFLVEDEPSVADNADEQNNSGVIPQGEVVQLVLVLGNEHGDLVLDFLFNYVGVVQIVEYQHKVKLEQFETHNIDLVLAKTVVTDFLRHIQTKIFNEILVKLVLEILHLSGAL